MIFNMVFGISFIVDFASATRVLLYNSNWWKLEDMKNKPNNTNIP